MQKAVTLFLLRARTHLQTLIEDERGCFVDDDAILISALLLILVGLVWAFGEWVAHLWSLR